MVDSGDARLKNIFDKPTYNQLTRNARLFVGAKYKAVEYDVYIIYNMLSYAILSYDILFHTNTYNIYSSFLCVHIHRALKNYLMKKLKNM